MKILACAHQRGQEHLSARKNWVIERLGILGQREAMADEATGLMKVKEADLEGV